MSGVQQRSVQFEQHLLRGLEIDASTSSIRHLVEKLLTPIIVRGHL